MNVLVNLNILCMCFYKLSSHLTSKLPDTSWPIKVRELEDGPVVEMQEVEQTLQRPARVRKTPEYLKDYIT